MAKKTLPKDFQQILENGDLSEIKAVFDSCDINAKGSYNKQSALAFSECSDDFTQWATDQGADIEETNVTGETPLHSRTRSWNGDIKVLLKLGADVHAVSQNGSTPLHLACGAFRPEKARLLIENGAALDAKNSNGETAFELALKQCANANLVEMVDLSELLINAGAARPEKSEEYVTKIGKQFEFHRDNFNKESIDECDAALKRLYDIFNVPPVPRRIKHDINSEISVKATVWQEQHPELWELLVPSSGPAQTVQGEVIRISGRISNELEGNGGLNWDNDYQKMADAFYTYIASGNTFGLSELSEAKKLIESMKNKNGSTARLAELAVKWVLINRTPIQLATPDYNR